MKIILAGGSGQVGTILSRAFHQSGHEVVVLSRTPGSAPWRTVQWDAVHPGPWKTTLDGADVVINLAGRSVNCRYGTRNRRLIRDSRVQSTRAIGAAITNAPQPPRVWLQASTATIYAHRFDAPNDEQSGLLGGHEPNLPDTWKFSLDVATAWERALNESATPQTRKVLLRSAIIMSPDRGGPFDLLHKLVQLGLGGKAGDGRQRVSWIHEADFVAAIEWLIAHEGISGPVNLAAPHPLPNVEFMRHLRLAAKVPIGLPATRWMLEIGAFLLRTETELILKSRFVIPGRLSNQGFPFQFPEWPEAARDLCRSKRRPIGCDPKRIA
jgi:uncharacterized protein (TIGR01777 family)